MLSELDEDDDDGDRPGEFPGEFEETIAIAMDLLGLLPHPPQLAQIPFGKLDSSPIGEDE